MFNQNYDHATYAAMQAGKPYASYRKTILGKVGVQTLSPFTGQPEGVLLFGQKGADTAVIDTWNEKEDLYFRRMNKRLFEVGSIIKEDRKETAEEKSIEQYSDEELKEVVNQRYISLQKMMNSINSEAVIYRMLELAREMEKSDKIIRAIESRLSYLQQDINKSV